MFSLTACKLPAVRSIVLFVRSFRIKRLPMFLFSIFVRVFLVESSGRKSLTFHIFALLKLRSYWTEVHHVFIQCSQIIADKQVEIEIAIFYAV